MEPKPREMISIGLVLLVLAVVAVLLVACLQQTTRHCTAETYWNCEEW